MAYMENPYCAFNLNQTRDQEGNLRKIKQKNQVKLIIKKNRSIVVLSISDCTLKGEFSGIHKAPFNPK